MKVKLAGAGIAAIMASLLLLAVSNPVAGLGLGVSPEKIVIQDALRGYTYEEYIKAYNPDDAENTYGLAASDNITGWVSYYLPDKPDTAITSILIPPKSNQRLLVKFAIPAETPNGSYDGELLVIVKPEAQVETGEGGVGVGLQIPVLVSIEVTGTQFISGKVNDIKAEKIEVGYPLRIVVYFENTGNVAATPLIQTTVLYNNENIAAFSSDDTTVAVHRTQLVEVEWNTTGKAPAQYLAKVVASLDGKVLAEKDLPFEILPLGTLSRSGEIKDVVIDGTTIVNFTSKVIATFANTGQIDTMAEFTGEVYLDGNLVQTITSDKLLVKRGNQEALTAYFTPEKPGKYTIKVQVNYEGKKSDVKEVNLDITALKDITLTPKSNPDGSGGANSFNLLYPIGGGVAILIFAAVVLFAVKRSRRPIL
jgi:hypothetical protein